MPIPCCRYALGSHTAKDMQHQLHPECFAGGPPWSPLPPRNLAATIPSDFAEKSIRKEITEQRKQETKFSRAVCPAGRTGRFSLAVDKI